MAARLHVSRLILWLNVILACVTELSAQWSPDVQGPQMLRVHASDENIQINVEGQTDQRTNRGDPIRRDYVLVEPTIGFALRGSIYHPNLLEFNLSPEFGSSWQVMRLDPSGGVRLSQNFLQRYELSFDVLRAKPYAAHFFAEQGRSHRDLDFFSRVQVDSERYGFHAGYTVGPFPFTCDVMHVAETATGGLGQATDVADNTFSFNVGRAEQKNHKTNLTYVLNTYNRIEGAVAPSTGTAQNATLLDSFSFGREEWISLHTTGLFSQLNSSASHNRSLAVQEHLGLPFRQILTGDCYYDFGDQRTDYVASRSQEARATVKHQLYKSLTSSFTVQGASLESRSRDTSLAEKRIGVAAVENYSKQLPGRGFLNISANWRGDRLQRETTGHVLYVANETITLSDQKPSFLSKPNVLEVSRVTNPVGVAYVETLDYVLVRHANVMEVRRVPGGNIPVGGNVMVDYSATPLPTDSYSTIMQYYSVRVDLFDRLIGLYGRLNRVDNFGGQSLVLRDLSDRAIGAEIQWRWLVIGAERDRQDSNLFPFYSKRLYQSCVLELGAGTTFTVDTEQSWTSFPDTGLERESRSFISRFQQQLASFVSWQIEGGLHRERGLGIDQDRKVARASLAFTYGKLRLNMSYDFEDENLVGELHRQQHVMLRVKRNF